MAQPADLLLEMEAKLRADANGVYLKEIEGQLFDYSMQVKRTLDSGLPPDEYQALTRLKESTDSSLNMVKRIWTDMHK